MATTSTSIFSRGIAQSTALYRGTNLGTSAFGTAGSANIEGGATSVWANSGLVGQTGAITAANAGIEPWALVDNTATGNGTGFAVYNTTNGVSSMLNNSTSYVSTLTASDNVVTTTGLTAASGFTAINSLTLNGTGSSLTIGAGNFIQLESGGLLGIGTVSVSGPGYLTSSGNTTVGNNAGELILQTPNPDAGGTTTLTISAQIYESGGGLTKAGNGTAVLGAGAPYQATFLGNTIVNNGTLQLNGGNQTIFTPFNVAATVGNAGLVTQQAEVLQVNPGGVVDLNGTTQVVNNFNSTSATDGQGGSVINSNASTVATLIISNSGNQTYSGTIGGGAGALNLVRDSGSTATFNSPLAYTGSTTLQGGLTNLIDQATINSTSAIDIRHSVLEWNDTGTTANSYRLGAAGSLAPITLDGGAFDFSGRSGTSDVANIGAVTLNSGSSGIYVANNGDGSATLNIASLSRTTGSEVTFSAGIAASVATGALGQNPYVYLGTAPTLVNGILGGWALVYNGTDLSRTGTITGIEFATYSTTTGVVGEGNFNYNNAGNAGNTFGAGLNTHLTGSQTLPGTVGSPATVSSNSLTMDGAGITVTFVNSGDTLSLQSGGILSGVDANSRVIGATPGQGNLTSTSLAPGSATQTELFIHNASANALTINSNIIDSASGPLNLVLDNASIQNSQIYLQGNNTYSGATYVNSVQAYLNSFNGGVAIPSANVYLSSSTNNGGDSETYTQSGMTLLANNQINSAATVTMYGGTYFNLNGFNQTLANLTITNDGNSQGNVGPTIATYGQYATNNTGGAGVLTVSGQIYAQTLGVTNAGGLANIGQVDTIPTINGLLSMTAATPTIKVDPSNLPGQIGLELNAVLTGVGGSANNGAIAISTGAAAGGVIGLGGQQGAQATGYAPYTGALNVAASTTVAFGAGGVNYGGSQVNLGSSTAVLDSRALTGYVGSIVGSGVIQNYNLNTAGAIFTGLDGTSGTFSGTINSPFSSGLLSITKVGAGTWTLTGNSYAANQTNSGTLAVSGGTVDVNATGALSFQTYALNPGGTLLLDDSGTAQNNRLGTAYNQETANISSTTSNRNVSFTGGNLTINGNASAAVTEGIGAINSVAGGGVLTLGAAGTGGVNVNVTAALAGQGQETSLLIRGSGLGNAAGSNTAVLTFAGGLGAPGTQGGGAVGTTTMTVRPDIIADNSSTGTGIGFLAQLGGNGSPVGPITGSELAPSLAVSNTTALLETNVGLSAPTSITSSVYANTLTMGSGDGISNGFAAGSNWGGSGLNQIYLNASGILALGNLGASGSTTTTISGGALESAGVTYDFNVVNQPSSVGTGLTTLIVNAPIVSASGWVKADSGTMVLEQPFINTNGGGKIVSVNGGTLQLAGGANTIWSQVGAAAAPSVTTLFVNNGTVDLAGNSELLGPLASTSSLPYAGGTAASPNAVILNSGSSAANLITYMTSAQTFAGEINNAMGSGAISLYQQGANVLTLESPSSLTGAVNIEGSGITLQDQGAFTGASAINVYVGTLNLNNQALYDVTSRVGSSPISLYSGTLAFNAREGVDSQTAGPLTAALGASTVTLGEYNNNQQSGTSTLTMNSLSQTAANAGTVNFTVSNGGTLGQYGGQSHVLFTAAPTLTGNIIGGWAVVNGADFASYNSTQGVGALGTTGFATYTTLPASNGVITTNYQATATTESILSQTVNSFAVRSPGAATVVGLSDPTQVLNINTGGFLVNDSGAKGVTIQGGQITAGGNSSSPATLYYYTNNNTQVFNSEIVNNNLTGAAVSLAKSGAGTMTLTPLVTDSVALPASGTSSLTVTSATGLFVGMNVSGTNMPAGATISSISGNTVNISGTTTETAAATVQVSFAPPTTSSATIAGSTTVTNNAFSFTPMVGMAIGGAGVPFGDTITAVTGTAGSYTLTLASAATATNSSVTLTYGAASNAYSGTTYVDQGTLNLTSYAGSSPLGASASIVIDNGATLAEITTNSAAQQINPASNITFNGAATLTLGAGINHVLNSLTFNDLGATAGIALAIPTGTTLNLTATGAGGAGSSAITAITDNSGFIPSITTGTLALGASPTITTGGVGLESLILTSPITVTSGPITFNGSGTTVMNNAANTFTGGVVLSGTAGLIVDSSSVGATNPYAAPMVSGPLGTGSITISGGNLLEGGAAETIGNNIVFSGTNPSLTLAGTVSSASNALTLSGSVALGTSTPTISVPAQTSPRPSPDQCRARRA